MTDEVPERAPTPIARRWVKYVVGFGVTTVVGLAPFLGQLNVPGFTPLLSLFPTWPFDTTKTLIPISAIFMGWVAVVIQFLSDEGAVSPRALRVGFAATTALVAIAALSLMLVHPRVVVQRSIPAKDSVVPVLVAFTRTHCERLCEQNISNSECLTYTTLDPDRIFECWGEQDIHTAAAVLALLYLTITAGFGFMIGGLMLRDRKA